MRICLVYDCLYPHTVGGGERWYRNLAEALADAGHEVTYLTLRQWDRGTAPDAPRGTRVLAVGPRLALYAGGRRRTLPPLVFGLGVLWHLLRRGRRYDVVHTAAFPYFSLLAAAAVRRVHGFRLRADWFEVWTRAYWREYLGRAGVVGWAVQRACARTRHRAVCFSRLHARRLREEGHAGEPGVLTGAYGGGADPPRREDLLEREPIVMFAGRHIPEKRVPALVDAFALLAADRPDARLELYGDGPERAEAERRLAAHGLGDRAVHHGFVTGERIEAAMRRAAVMALPSRREGYGMVVVEASAAGTPSVVVADPDNAATELVEEGRNGVVAPAVDPPVLAAALARALDGGAPLRERTARWYADNAERVSLRGSIEAVVASYGR